MRQSCKSFRAAIIVNKQVYTYIKGRHVNKTPKKRYCVRLIKIADWGLCKRVQLNKKYQTSRDNILFGVYLRNGAFVCPPPPHLHPPVRLSDTSSKRLWVSKCLSRFYVFVKSYCAPRNVNTHVECIRSLLTYLAKVSIKDSLFPLRHFR